LPARGGAVRCAVRDGEVVDLVADVEEAEPERMTLRSGSSYRER
jgi:hypothetical protein